MEQSADIIIIGAGLMGASSALNLAHSGKKVILLEKEMAPCHASAVNAGGVRQLNRALEEIPISVAAMELWPKLTQIVGNDCGFRSVGQVRIAPDEPAMKLFEKRGKDVEGIGFFHEELVSPAEIKKLVPAYSEECWGGIVSRQDGFALPAVTLKSFLNSAQNAGASLFTQCKVMDIIQGENGFRVLVEDGRTFKSEAVINCSGAWGNQVASILDNAIPIEPTGLAMMVAARMPRFITPVIGVHGRKLSFKQMENGTVVIGGALKGVLDMTREKTDIDFSEMKESAKTVTQHFSIMKNATIVRTWAGIEGIMDDKLPVIDASQKVPGLFHVCGFSAHGFQLAPMIGRLVSQLVTGKTPELSLKAFSLNRFITPPT